MELHPLQAAWRERDLDLLAASLAPGVVLNSPMLRKPFRGRDEAVQLFGVLFDTFGLFEITDEFADGENSAFFWRAEVGGKTIEGVDLVRLDTDGKIAEITVQIRPLINIAIFAAAIGPPLAAKRGRIRGWLVRLMSIPLTVFLTITDVAASRLVQKS